MLHFCHFCHPFCLLPRKWGWNKIHSYTSPPCLFVPGVSSVGPQCFAPLIRLSLCREGAQQWKSKVQALHTMHWNVSSKVPAKICHIIYCHWLKVTKMWSLWILRHHIAADCNVQHRSVLQQSTLDYALRGISQSIANCATSYCCILICIVLHLTALQCIAGWVAEICLHY